jgi:hypothetical protein
VPLAANCARRRTAASECCRGPASYRRCRRSSRWISRRSISSTSERDPNLGSVRPNPRQSSGSQFLAEYRAAFPLGYLGIVCNYLKSASVDEIGLAARFEMPNFRAGRVSDKSPVEDVIINSFFHRIWG